MAGGHAGGCRHSFPHFLNNAGYRGAQIGKWHLGERDPGLFDAWKSFNSQIHHWLGEPCKSPYRPAIQTERAVEFIDNNTDRPFSCISPITCHLSRATPRKGPMKLTRA